MSVDMSQIAPYANPTTPSTNLILPHANSTASSEQAVEIKAAARSIAPTIPQVYLKYVDEKCLHLVDSKKSPNKEFITFLLSSITTRFRSQYPSLGDDFTV